MSEWRRHDLSFALKRAMVTLLEDGSLMKNGSRWKGSSLRTVTTQSVTALYDRYLIKIVVESRYRRRHCAILTDIGQYAAREIQRELTGILLPAPPHNISEQSARFITEVTG
jgi:hypothetical protein